MYIENVPGKRLGYQEAQSDAGSVDLIAWQHRVPFLIFQR